MFAVSAAGPATVAPGAALKGSRPVVSRRAAAPAHGAACGSCYRVNCACTSGGHRRHTTLTTRATASDLDWKQPEDWPFKEKLVPVDASPELRARILEEDRVAHDVTVHEDVPASLDELPEGYDESFEALLFQVPLADATEWPKIDKDKLDYTTYDLANNPRGFEDRDANIFAQYRHPEFVSQGVVRTQSYLAAEGKEEEVSKILTAHRDRVRAKMTEDGTQESKGIEEFEISCHPNEPRVFQGWERFATIQDSIDFVSSEAWLAVGREVAPLLEEPAQMMMYDWKDGSIGQPRLPFGPTGEGGLDDATGASGGLGGAGYKQHTKLELGKVKRGDEGDAFGMDKESVSAAMEAAEKIEEKAKEGLEELSKSVGKGFANIMNNFISRPSKKPQQVEKEGQESK